jgi:malonyl-CoA/methylmalonyl-CoA synthetase
VSGGTAPAGATLGAWRAHAGRRSSDAALRRFLTRGSIPHALARTARRRPDTLAVVVDDDAVTFAELEDRARRLASRLVSHPSVREARDVPRVLLAAPNSVEFAVGYLAVLYAGATAVLAGSMLTPTEVATLVEVAAPTAALAAGARVDELREIGGLTPVVDLSEARRDAGSAGSSWPRCPLPSPGPSTPAHIAFTSGTTGIPKAAPLSHANVLASVRGVLVAWRWEPRDVLVHALPLQHGHGLSGLHASVLAGTTTAVLSHFDPERLAAHAARHGATVLFAVPAIYEKLLEAGILRAPALRALRLATSGSAPLQPTTSDAVAEALGQRPLERYGLTETGFVLSNLYGHRRAGGVGVPLPGAEVRVADADGAEVAAGTAGRILVRGPQVFSGYDAGAGRPPSRDGFVADGTWFDTGDLGVVHTASRDVTITGRAKDVIITGGLNVSPVEVELVLQRLPGVAAAAVVGVPSRRWGEEVTAFVVPSGDPPDEAALRRAIAAQLAAYKRPKSYYFVADLPRNELGKVRRQDLVPLAVARD